MGPILTRTDSHWQILPKDLQAAPQGAKMGAVCERHSIGPEGETS